MQCTACHVTSFTQCPRRLTFAVGWQSHNAEAPEHDWRFGLFWDRLARKAASLLNCSRKTDCRGVGSGMEGKSQDIMHSVGNNQGRQPKWHEPLQGHVGLFLVAGWRIKLKLKLFFFFFWNTWQWCTLVTRASVPKQRGVQVAGVQMALDASFPAMIELPGLLTIHRRAVLLHSLTAPLCKGCKGWGGCYQIKVKEKKSCDSNAFFFNFFFFLLSTLLS